MSGHEGATDYPLGTGDAERDRLIAGLQQAGVTRDVYWLDGFQQLQGKNGGGDPWHTDGRLQVAVLVMPSHSQSNQ